MNWVDPFGLETEVIIWGPSGYGRSSFGHVSVNIDGKSYSFGPEGMDKRSKDEYLSKNTFRDGIGMLLNLTPDQEARIQACLADNQGEYGRIRNNCTAPIQRCLKEIGIDLGWNVKPVSLEGSLLLYPGLIQKYNEYNKK